MSSTTTNSTATSPINARRVAMGMTIRGLAGLCDVSTQIAYMWDRGKGFPRARNLVRLAKHFGCHAEDLVGIKSIGVTPDAALPADLAVASLADLPDDAFTRLLSHA